MRRYVRAKVLGAQYFFTLVTFDRQPLLGSDDAVDLLNETLAIVTERHPFQLDAFVILPDHLHMIWNMPDGDSDFSTRLMLIKSRFTRQYAKRFPLSEPDASRARRREQTVWQRRYWEHLIRDDADYARHVDYIHCNPAKHGLVGTLGDWPHSSLASFVATGRYPAEPDVATFAGLTVEGDRRLALSAAKPSSLVLGLRCWASLRSAPAQVVHNLLANRQA